MEQKEVEERIKDIRSSQEYFRSLQQKLSEDVIKLRKYCDHNKTEIEYFSEEEYLGYGDFNYSERCEDTCVICRKVLRVGKRKDEDYEIEWEE